MAFIVPQEFDLPVPLKRCTRCEQWKPLAGFSVRKSGKRVGERLSYCKPCNSRKVVEHHRANRAAVNAYERKWRAANTDKARAQWARARTKLLEKNPNHWRDLYWRYRPSRLISMRNSYYRRRAREAALIPPRIVPDWTAVIETDALWATIWAAIPAMYYGDLKDEIAQTLALMVLNKEIGLDELPAVAKQAARQIQRTSLSNRFRFKSLDAPISVDNPTPLSASLVG